MTTYKAGKNYPTRGGYEARVYAVESNGDFPIHGAILLDGVWRVQSWTKEGKYYIHGNSTELDLLPPPPEPLAGELWINVYQDKTGDVVHTTRAAADVSQSSGRIACIRIDLSKHHVGEGL